MNKPDKALIHEQLKNIQANSKALVDALIWYEQQDMDDWMYEIVGHFEKLDPTIELKLILEDLPNRTTEDLNTYGYQRLFIGLINSNPELWKQVPDKVKNTLIKTWSFLV